MKASPKDDYAQMFFSLHRWYWIVNHQIDLGVSCECGSCEKQECFQPTCAEIFSSDAGDENREFPVFCKTGLMYVIALSDVHSVQCVQ